MHLRHRALTIGGALAIVAVVFYSLSKLVRMPEDWRVREYHHIYSWAASALVSLLMWYELQSVTVAVGWAVFGLVLFEYGLMRNVRQFRFQSYVALTAAFTRIFFANLTAGTSGEFWGPRIYTVLPITLILFFVIHSSALARKMFRKTPVFASTCCSLTWVVARWLHCFISNLPATGWSRPGRRLSLFCSQSHSGCIARSSCIKLCF